MAKNYVFHGQTIPVTLSGDVSSGDGIVVGTLLGVALNSGGDGDTIQVAIEGVWDLPALETADIAVGAKFYWGVTAGEAISTGQANGDLDGGAIAIEASGTSSTTVRAKLCPGTGLVVSGL